MEWGGEWNEHSSQKGQDYKTNQCVRASKKATVRGRGRQARALAQEDIVTRMRAGI